MKFALILGCCISFSLLTTACTTTSQTTAMQRDLYLEQFIGQSSQYIQANLDLTRLGYQQVQSASVTPNRITYTVIRPIAIPLSIPQSIAGSQPGAVPIQVNSNPERYDVHLQCIIVFTLENQIAKSVHYTGRTC
ncbi:hypothetical protein IQR32_02480 [Acinetobacter albensis]|uniref:Uncharacterized protein n=1 Tax=Acinetobacter albensis TaxID=1673609 RepID=A0A1C4GSZ4_9GAMM|nr:hypothetical protein [Acinetobacter albensis]MBE9400225.1 hypothetical protein [Acinetobacter albensis]SCC71328.1 hypothetical protein GA0116959_103178 [Acinetobacter albensis]